MPQQECPNLAKPEVLDRGSPNNNMGLYKYSLLIKCNKKGLSDLQIKDTTRRILARFRERKLVIDDEVYELGKHGRLHLHCKATTTFKVIYKKFRVKGWLISFKPLRNEVAYTNYLKKEQQLQSIYDYYQTYRFTDKEGSEATHTDLKKKA